MAHAYAGEIRLVKGLNDVETLAKLFPVQR